MGGVGERGSHGGGEGGGKQRVTVVGETLLLPVSERKGGREVGGSHFFSNGFSSFGE